MAFFRWLVVVFVGLALSLSTLYVYFIHISPPDVPDLQGKLISSTLTVDGIERTYHVYKPSELAEDAPLLFVLHGSLSEGQDMRGLTAYGFEQLADREGFLVVYPDGYDRHWNDCRASATYRANTENIDDVKFLQTLTQTIATDYSVASDKIFSTGYSNGGHMSYRLALEIPNLVQAIAPVAASLPVDHNFDCSKAGKPANVAIINGTEDPVNPYDGGLVEILGDSTRGEVMSSIETVEYWRSLMAENEAIAESNVIEKETLTERDGNPATKVSVQKWTGISQQVRLYTLHGSGHVVPSNEVRYGALFGGGAGDVEAADIIWSFFKDTLNHNPKSSFDDSQESIGVL